MQEGTAQTAQVAREQAGNVAGTAKEQARNVAQDAKEQVRGVAHQVQQDVRQRADTEATRLAQTLRDTGSQLRDMADAGGQQGFPQTLVREGAQAAERFAERLENGGVEGVLAEFRSFARRNPGSFLLGAAAFGFVAGRLVRNLSSEGNDGFGGNGYGGNGSSQYGTQYGSQYGGYGTDAPESMLGDPETEISTGLYAGTQPPSESQR